MAGHTDTYDAAGSFNWRCPVGVTSVALRVSAGSGGGGVDSGGVGGGGGGGGALVTAPAYTVVAGTLYTLHVGAGGDPQSDGANSTFDGTNVVAVGGKQGTSDGSGTGGTGGSSSTVPSGGAETVGNAGGNASDATGGLGGAAGDAVGSGGPGKDAGEELLVGGSTGVVKISYTPFVSRMRSRPIGIGGRR